MRSRPLFSTAVALGLSWLVLAWGLVALGGVFIREREDALRSLEGRREALGLYADRALAERLDALLRDAAERIPITIADPLLPANDLYLREDGNERLPRRPTPRPGDATPGAALAEQVAHGEIPAGDPSRGDPETDPWTERLRIARAFVAAVRLDDRGQIEARFRALLAHQVRYHIDATLDLPSRLGLIELFSRESHPDPELLLTLLRSGVSGAGGSVVAGLERALLEARDRFSAPDFAALADRLAALAESVGVPYDDFFARAQEPAPDAPAGIDSVVAPSLVGGGGWIVRPAGTGRIEGTRIELDRQVAAVLDEMRGRGVVGPADTIQTRSGNQAVVPLAELGLGVESPEWSRAAAAIDDRFRWKVGLLLGSALVALALVALAVAFQRQGRRIVEMQGAFVSAVSHELRTPLASIRLLAETLERRLDDVPAARDYPARIVRATDGLAFLVENLLSVQRLDRGRGLAERGVIKLDELFHRIVEETSASLGVDVRIDLSRVHAPTLVADPSLVAVLLSNLVRNACLYNSRSPVEITVASERVAGSVVLRIGDNGRGLGEADRPLAFQAFHRGSAAEVRATAGTGLGLSLCKRIVELHGGTITIPESSSNGTTFELRFPAPHQPSP